jgi:hypothetical protein
MGIVDIDCPNYIKTHVKIVLKHRRWIRNSNRGSELDQNTLGS